MTWHKAAHAKAIDPGSVARFAAGGHDYLLSRVSESEWRASDLSCTHAFSELDFGALVGTQLSCVSHGAIFDLKDGSVVCPPATRPLRVFPVKVEGEDVLVDIPEGDAPPTPDE